MKRSEFLVRLAIENKLMLVSETLDVVQIPDNSLSPYKRPESRSSLLSTSPTLQSPIHDSSLQNNSKKCDGDIVTDVIENPVIKPSYKDCFVTSTQCEQKNVTARPSNNTERVLQQGNKNHSYANSTTIEQSPQLTSAKYSLLPESYHPDLKIQEIPLTQSLIEKSPTSSNNKAINIISEVILKPATPGETTVQCKSEYDVYEFYEGFNKMDTETGNKGPSRSLVSDNSKNLTLLAPLTSLQDFIENSSHFETSRENTDGFNICPVYKETENGQITQLEVTEPSNAPPLELYNNLPSNANDEHESPGDEYVPFTGGDDDSFDSEPEICVRDVHRTYSNNTQENITVINMDEKRQQTYSKDTLQRNPKCVDPDTNKLGTKLSKQIESTKETNTDIYPETSLVYVILNPATSGETISAQCKSEYDEGSNKIDTETGNKGPSGSVVSDSSKNLTLLVPSISRQDFDISPVCNKTENGQITPLEITEPSISPLELYNILPSDADDEYESSGDEFVPPTDDDDSSDSGSEICVEDVHRIYSSNTQKNITIMNMDEKAQTVTKNTLQKHPKSFDLDTSKLDTRLTKIESNKETNIDIYPETSLVTNQQYTRKQSARERPTICPLCYEDVITHFPRHLSRHHPKDPEVKRMLSLKPKSKERLELVSAFRKRGYFILKTEKDVSHPVRSSKDSDTNYFTCTFCLGLYNKKTLYRHVQVCKSKPCDITNPGKNCLSKSQTFMTSKNHEFLRTSRLKKEVFETMRADFVSNVAKSDPLICLYGEVLISKHKRQQIATLVSNKIREMAKMLIAIRSMHDDIKGLFDVLKPEMFATFVAAAKIISGYNENKKSFRAPSLALHMGTNLKIICNIAFKTVIERKQIPNMSWENRDEKKNDIKDLRKLIEAHWCNELSSLALKDLKERQWKKPSQLPLSEDILLFKKYIEETSENAYESLQNGINVKDSYKKLTECVLAQTVMFNRKRVGDVQYLKIEVYEREHSSTTQKAFSESLTDLEKLLCRQFKRVITDGKGSKPVPILFSKRTQRYISSLLKIRKTTNIVPESNPYLFANPGVENKWIRGDYVIRLLAKKCGAEHPALLTSTKFRKHIATTLQLMNMGADEMEQVATFMGHTKKTHEQFYRLPQDIYQTAKVAKVLLLLEKGKGKEFRGKNLEEINLDEDYSNSGTSDEENIDEVGITTKNKKKRINDDTDITKEIGKQIGEEEISRINENDGKVGEEKANEKDIDEVITTRKRKGRFNGCTNITKEIEKQIGDEEIYRMEENGGKVEEEKTNNDNTAGLRKKITKIQTKDKEIGDNEEKENDKGTENIREKRTKIQAKEESTSRLKANVGRSRWTSAEKKLVEIYFRKHIKHKITPKKHECEQFFSKYGDKMVGKDWVKVKTFVYNTFRQK